MWRPQNEAMTASLYEAHLNPEGCSETSSQREQNLIANNNSRRKNHQDTYVPRHATIPPPKWSHEGISIEYESRIADVQQDFVTIWTKRKRGMKIMKLSVTITTAYNDMQPRRPQNGTMSASFIQKQFKIWGVQWAESTARAKFSREQEYQN